MESDIVSIGKAPREIVGDYREPETSAEFDIESNPVFTGIAPERIQDLKDKVGDVFAIWICLPENRSVYELYHRSIITKPDSSRDAVSASRAALEAVKGQTNIQQFVNIFGNEVVAAVRV